MKKTQPTSWMGDAAQSACNGFYFMAPFMRPDEVETETEAIEVYIRFWEKRAEELKSQGAS